MLEGTTIRFSEAVNGAGVFSYAEATISGAIISENVASNHGGGVRSHLRMSIENNSEISQNEAVNDYGGVYSDGIMIISDSRVVDNSAGRDGGGIFNGWPSSDTLSSLPKELTLERSQVSGNTAGNNGGGIYSVRRRAVIDSQIDGNTATSGSGGGIYSVSVSHTGATSNNGGELHIDRSTISHNTAGLTGGGLYSDTMFAGASTAIPEAPLTIQNSTIAENKAASGGGLYMWGLNDGHVRIAFSTIVTNDAGGAAGTGGGIINGRDNVELLANIIALNESTLGSNDRDIDPSLNDLQSLGHNIFGSSPHANLNRHVTDQLPPGTSDVQLKLSGLANNGGPTQTMALGAGSIAANAVPSPAGLNRAGEPLTVDQRGMPRAIGGSCRIGAFEYQ